MNEKAEILFDAVTGIRPELVERALEALTTEVEDQTIFEV